MRDIDNHTTTLHDAIKTGFFGRSKHYANDERGLREAIKKMPTDVKSHESLLIPCVALVVVLSSGSIPAVATQSKVTPR